MIFIFLQFVECYVDDFHFIEEMFSNPIGFIWVLDFFDFGSEFSGKYIYFALFLDFIEKPVQEAHRLQNIQMQKENHFIETTSGWSSDFSLVFLEQGFLYNDFLPFV